MPWELTLAENGKNCPIYLQSNNPARSLDFKSPLLGVGLAVKDRTGEVDAVQGIGILRGPRIIQVTFLLVVEEPAGFPAPDGPLAAKFTQIATEFFGGRVQGTGAALRLLPRQHLGAPGRAGRLFGAGGGGATLCGVLVGALHRRWRPPDRLEASSQLGPNLRDSGGASQEGEIWAGAGPVATRPQETAGKRTGAVHRALD